MQVESSSFALRHSIGTSLNLQPHDKEMNDWRSVRPYTRVRANLDFRSWISYIQKIRPSISRNFFRVINCTKRTTMKFHYNSRTCIVHMTPIKSENLTCFGHTSSKQDCTYHISVLHIAKKRLAAVILQSSRPSRHRPSPREGEIKLLAWQIQTNRWKPWTRHWNKNQTCHFVHPGRCHGFWGQQMSSRVALRVGWT